MSTEDRYQGWANRETWAVALHINNDQGWQESVLDALRNYMPQWEADQSPMDITDTLRAYVAGEAVREQVEEYLYERLPQNDDAVSALQIAADIGSLWRVDWTELGAAFLADLDAHGKGGDTDD